MIKVTYPHFVRVVNSIQETEQQIERNPTGSFVEFNKLHVAALRKLVLELDVVDYLSSDEVLVESERLFRRMNSFKGISI